MLYITYELPGDGFVLPNVGQIAVAEEHIVSAEVTCYEGGTASLRLVGKTGHSIVAIDDVSHADAKRIYAQVDEILRERA